MFNIYLFLVVALFLAGIEFAKYEKMQVDNVSRSTWMYHLQQWFTLGGGMVLMLLGGYVIGLEVAKGTHTGFFMFGNLGGLLVPAPLGYVTGRYKYFKAKN